jgi:hypothetical protein
VGEWDDLMKMLVRAYPQDLVSLVLRDAHFLEDITTELEDVSTELKIRTVQADFLCKAERNGKK